MAEKATSATIPKAMQNNHPRSTIEFVNRWQKRVGVGARQRTAAIVSESEVSDVYCRLRSLPSFQALVFPNIPDKRIS